MSAVKVGNTAQDVDFQYYGTGSLSAIIDCGAKTLTLVGITSTTNKPLTITDATATSSTTTGALIVTGGIATAADITCGDDLFMASSGAVINFNSGNLTLTHSSGTITNSGILVNTGAITANGGISSSGQTLTPDANRTYIAYQVGSRATEKNITMTAAASQNLDPIQMNLNIVGAAPTSTSTVNGIYQQITHDTTAMANIRIKAADWTVSIGKNATDAYVYQGELQHTATATLTGESICMSALTYLSAGVTVTADRVCALQAMISGDGAAATVTGDCFVAYIVNAGTVVTTDSICCIHNQSAATAISGLELDLDGTVTYAFDFDGTVPDAWTTATAGTSITPKGEYVLIPVDVAGTTNPLFILAAQTHTAA